MRVIVKRRWRKNSDEHDVINVFAPVKQGQLTDLLRELWEKEYNSYDPEPDRDLSWFEECHARIENEIFITEFVTRTLIVTEVDR